MKRLLSIAAIVCLGVAVPAATPGEGPALSGPEIVKTLTGNSIISPEFGCVHFREGGQADLFQDGQLYEGSWRVDGDLYFSSGQCGKVGCRFFGEYPLFTFRRIDGSYEQKVILIYGNYCEKDGVIS